MKQSAIMAALASQLLVAPSHAEALNPLVVTAGRIAENPANVSSDITVISREEIESSQAVHVADLLKSLAGIDISSSGGPGKTTTLFIRGGNSSHALVLIDGVRVGSATVGSFDWGNLSTADIERIEIVRGSQSSLYGADAMSGVIQIFTRKGAEKQKVEVAAESGSYGTSSANVSVSGKANAVTYAVSASKLKSDGFSAAANGTENDGYDRTTFSARVGFAAGEADIELIQRNVDATTDLDGYDPITFTFGDVLNYTNNYKQSVSSAKVVYPFSDQFETTLQISRSTDNVVGKDPVTAGNNSDFKTTIDQLTLQNHWDLGEGSVLFGVDVHSDKGVSSSAGLDKSMDQQAAFASVAWKLNQLNLNGSVRMDQNSVFSDQNTYKLGAVYHINSDLKFLANYGTAFKAPSLNDLYYPLDGWGSVGNPNLTPEKSSGWDAGIAYAFDGAAVKGEVGATWFNQKYSDLIVWNMDPITFGFSPVNVNKASTKGMELQAELDFDKLFVRANWTTLNATDDASGLILARRAKESGHLVLGTDVSGLHAEVQLDLVGKRFSDTSNTQPLDKYQKTDVRLSYAINDTWAVKLRVENVQDTKYEEVSGYGVAGRSTYAGVSASF